MTILFDATQKSTAPRSFGRGILPSYPVYQAPVSVADMEWAAEHLNGEAIDWDAAFAWVEAMELIEAGYCYL